MIFQNAILTDAGQAFLARANKGGNPFFWSKMGFSADSDITAETIKTTGSLNVFLTTEAVNSSVSGDVCTVTGTFTNEELDAGGRAAWCALYAKDMVPLGHPEILVAFAPAAGSTSLINNKNNGLVTIVVEFNIKVDSAASVSMNTTPTGLASADALQTATLNASKLYYRAGSRMGVKSYKNLWHAVARAKEGEMVRVKQMNYGGFQKLPELFNGSSYKDPDGNPLFEVVDVEGQYVLIKLSREPGDPGYMIYDMCQKNAGYKPAIVGKSFIAHPRLVSEKIVMVKIKSKGMTPCVLAYREPHSGYNNKRQTLLINPQGEENNGGDAHYMTLFEDYSHAKADRGMVFFLKNAQDGFSVKCIDFTKYDVAESTHKEYDTSVFIPQSPPFGFGSEFNEYENVMTTFHHYGKKIIKGHSRFFIVNEKERKIEILPQSHPGDGNVCVRAFPIYNGALLIEKGEDDQGNTYFTGNIYGGALREASIGHIWTWPVGVRIDGDLANAEDTPRIIFDGNIVRKIGIYGPWYAYDLKREVPDLLVRCNVAPPPAPPAEGDILHSANLKPFIGRISISKKEDYFVLYAHRASVIHNLYVKVNGRLEPVVDI